MPIDLRQPTKRLERKFEKAWKEARSAALTFLMRMNHGMEGQLVDELWLVHFAIASRVVHLHSAIGVLLRDRHPSVAAIVALTQYELRLDARYINTETPRATAWVEHSNEARQPWPVKTKIDAVYGEQEGAEAHAQLFKWLSGVKHGNPAWSNSAFSLRSEGVTKRIATDEFDDDRTSAKTCLLYALSAWQVFDTLSAAGAVFRHFNGLGVEAMAEIVRGRESTGTYMAAAGALCTRAGLFGSDSPSWVKVDGLTP